MVVIAEGTRGLLGNLFEFEDLGAKDLKGVAGPCEPGRRCQRVRRKAASRHCTRRVTALVGREEELEWRWSRAKTGEGQVGVALRRGRYRKVAAHGRAAGTTRSRTAHAVALLLLPAAHRQRVLSYHRLNGVAGEKRRVDGRIARRGQRRRSEPLAAQASTNATGKAGAGDSCAVLTHKRILSNTSTAARLRRVCPPKS
jgi:hypothetical protein